MSDISQDDAWGWPCPYCRAHNPVDSRQCANCGSQLRDTQADDLFTTVAADNAEVVPPEVPFARDNMWTTEANPVPDPGDPVSEAVDGVADGEVVDDDPDPTSGGDPVDDGEDLWDEVSAPPPSGAPFSADPTRRAADVLDEPFESADEMRVPTANGAGGPLFGGRVTRQDVAGATATSTPPPIASPAHGAPSHAAPFQAPSSSPGSGPPLSSSWAAPPSMTSAPQASAAPPGSAPVPDVHGLAASVGRLRPDAAEVAAVPISVAGALLHRDEVVLAAVTGQMLGHPAVVVLTNHRVLVVNGRRWQPIVDSFGLGPDLIVRGRHDRDIASLTFSEGDQLSTVDAITEVALAVELAERVRGV